MNKGVVFVIFYYDHYVLKDVFTYGILTIYGKEFWGTYVNLDMMCAMNFVNVT